MLFRILCCILFGVLPLFAKENGFLYKSWYGNNYWIRQITLLDNKKFIWSELSSNPQRDFEELKITGKWEIVENKKVLLPEMCSLYTFHKFYQKQALIRTFDCDHLKYSILENSNEWIVSPAMKSEAETENYFKWKSTEEELGGYVLESEDGFFVYGNEFKTITKNYEAFWYKPPIRSKIEIEDLYDSTISISKHSSVKLGDYVLVLLKLTKDFE